MGWLGLILFAAGFIALFVLWDVIFCGGERCQTLIDRMRDWM